MLENLKSLIPKKQTNYPSKDFFLHPVEIGDLIIKNCNSHFKLGYVLSISERTILISCIRSTSKWRKKPYVLDPYRENLEELLKTLKDHNGTLRIFNSSFTLINLTKLNFIP
jgi:hypothetical protein